MIRKAAWEAALAASLFNSLDDFWHSFSTLVGMKIYLLPCHAEVSVAAGASPTV